MFPENELDSMCTTWQHDFGLLNEEEKEKIRNQLRGLYEHHVKAPLEAVQEALNGPYPAEGVHDIIRLAKEAGEALQRIGRTLSMQGWDWDTYADLPPMLEKTIADLAIDKREAENQAELL